MSITAYDTQLMRILMVEDDSRISDFVMRGLKAEGYTVEVCNRGSSALPLALSGEFRLLILDLGLPDIDGRTLCGQLREQGSQIPILMLTARDEVADKVSGLRAGADDYLTKPFAFEELLARVQALMRRRRDEFKLAQTELTIADLTLNRETHIVSRAGIPIELTPKEFAMLECFMCMPGKVLSRTRILEQVWGYSADPLTNVVDVYIRQLRRKIDDNFEPKLLKTIRGYGYKMDAS
ncbi:MULTISPECIES: response regulator transcription factor [Methylomonas]|uniref:response regulator transcription factor n=1 Tax=Methylomonas TaxID=416 RepID=UPI001E404E57|nr:response regulator transcription factor [Methylomonas rhizoryzae]